MSIQNINRTISQLISSEEVIDINKVDNSKSIFELIESNNRVVLLGEPGVGKSFEMERLFNYYWDSRNEINLYPIFISLKKYHNKFRFEELIPFENWKTLPNIIFILDGLDETAYPHDFLSVLEVFINSNKGKNYRFIISSRTNIYLSYQLHLESFKAYKLNPLNTKQINAILKNQGAKDITVDHVFLGKHPFYSSPFFLKALIEYYKVNEEWLKSENEIWSYYVESELKAFVTKQLKQRQVLVPKEKKRLCLISLVNELQGKNQFSEEDLYKIFGDEYIEIIVNPFIRKSEIEDSMYSFEHRQYQEYFSALVLKELSFAGLKSIINIDGVDKIKPSLTNVVSLLISICDDKLFNNLSDYLLKNDIEILIKSDSLRIPMESKFSIFERYFTQICIDKTLWIGTNSSVSVSDLSLFADSIESFNFLIEIIKNEKLNLRARISAVNLLKEFKSINNEKLSITIENVLKSDSDINYKSTVIRLINSLNIEDRIRFFRKIIDKYSEECNKVWNSSLLSVLVKLDNIDEFFDYLKREFKWSNELIKRKESDNVQRGNSWIVKDLVMRLKNESNFLELITFYFNDYDPATNAEFRGNLIKKCIYFEKKNSGFIMKIINEFQNKGEIRSFYNDEILSELVNKCNKELDVFKAVFDYNSSNEINSVFLSRITTNQTIDYYVSLIAKKNVNRARLSSYRNMIFNYGSRELAIYLENCLMKEGIDIGDKILTEDQAEKKKKQYNKDIQNKVDLLFQNENLIQKISGLISELGKNKINQKNVRNLERSHYEEDRGWYRVVKCEFEVLFVATNFGHSWTAESLKIKLKTSRQIQLMALKRMLESNNGTPVNFELTTSQNETITQWISSECKKINFENLVRFDSLNGFTPLNLHDYRFLKAFYYFLEIKEYSHSFDQKFLLDSIVFYRMEESGSNLEQFNYLINLINDKEKLKELVITKIKEQIFIFPMERLIIYALNHDFSEVYDEIYEFLEISTHSPGDNVFKLYLEKNRKQAIELTERISIDLSIYRGWSALLELVKIPGKEDYCIKRCLEYLSNGGTEYKDNAMRILFMQNHPEAFIYFINNIGNYPLDNIGNKFKLNYYISIDLFLERFNEAFIKIYQIKKEDNKTERDWEFSENNGFFTQLISNVLKSAEDKVNAYSQLEIELNKIQEESNDDSIVFYANSISEILKNNYISQMASPLSFKEALELSNNVIR